MANLITALRLNMTHLPEPAADHSARYQAALDMAEYADEQSFTIVNCEEHHVARNGWLPSPLMMAAAIAGRTRKININITALLITLYDPVRLAEDIAVLDNLSNGRFNFVAGLGYRPEEYHAVGREWDKRGQLMDECLDVMLKAWGNESFDHKGKLINVTPKPKSKPHPFFFVGGMSAAAAKRAARFGLPFYPPMHLPDVEKVYLDAMKQQGKQGMVYYPRQGSMMTLIHEDPDTAWKQFTPYILNETAEYSSWKREGVPRPSENGAHTMEELQAEKKFEIVTPEQCLANIRNGRHTLVFNPLVGGLPLDEGWKTLRLFVEQVKPYL
jgi:alkanesulfonate monooxygenase SsuD/methylene tetrahydromethanopterin reductase-like flavin-dependent oxidoreductase (luciferase family)